MAIFAVAGAGSVSLKAGNAAKEPTVFKNTRRVFIMLEIGGRYRVSLCCGQAPNWANWGMVIDRWRQDP